MSILTTPQWPDIEPRDRAILEEREAAFNRRKGPRVGDYVRMPDGKLERFAHDWGDGLQTTDGRFGGATFYLNPEGFVSMSGSLNPSIPNEKIVDTGETMMGRFWFFHLDYWTAGNGLDVEMMVRVYEARA